MITTLQEYKTYKESFVKKFELTKLPPYLILVIKVYNHFMHNYDDVKKNFIIYSSTMPFLFFFVFEAQIMFNHV